jgi:glutaredoxin
MIAAVVTALVGGIGFVFTGELPAKVRPTAALSAEDVEPARNGFSEAPPGAADEPAAPAAAPAAKHVFYQWVDERGSVRFARSLEEVPAAWRERAGQVEIDASSFTKAKPRAGARAARGATPEATAYAGAAHDVTVYTAPWCGWCRKTLAFLDERGVEYVNKNIEADEEFADELEEKSGGRSIPLVDIDGSLIRGYNPGEMAALLE